MSNKAAPFVILGVTTLAILGIVVLIKRSSSLKITSPNPMANGGTLVVSYSGFAPGATVTFLLTGGVFPANYTNLQIGTSVADSSGAGTDSFVFDLGAATYQISATDSSGHSASASLTVT